MTYLFILSKILTTFVRTLFLHFLTYNASFLTSKTTLGSKPVDVDPLHGPGRTQ